MIRELIFRVQRLFGMKHEEPLLRLPEILGFYPRDWSYYQLAFTHSSAMLQMMAIASITNA